MSKRNNTTNTVTTIGAVICYLGWFQQDWVDNTFPNGGWSCEVSDPAKHFSKFMFSESVDGINFDEEEKIENKINQRLRNVEWNSEYEIYRFKSKSRGVYFLFFVSKYYSTSLKKKLMDWMKKQIRMDNDVTDAKKATIKSVTYYEPTDSRLKVAVRVDDWKCDVVENNNKGVGRKMHYSPNEGTIEIEDKLSNIYGYILNTFDIVWKTDDKGFIKIYRSDDNEISVLLCECNQSEDELQELAVWMLDLIEGNGDIGKSEKTQIQDNNDNTLVRNEVGVLTQSEYFIMMNKNMNDRKQEKIRRRMIANSKVKSVNIARRKLNCDALMTDKDVEDELNVKKERVYDMMKKISDSRKKEKEYQMGHTTIGQIEANKKDIEDNCRYSSWAEVELAASDDLIKIYRKK